MYYIDNSCTDPYFNLALEQYVFDRLAVKKDFFILGGTIMPSLLESTRTPWRRLMPLLLRQTALKWCGVFQEAARFTMIWEM